MQELEVAGAVGYSSSSRTYRVTHNSHTPPRNADVRARAFCGHLRARSFHEHIGLPLSENFDGLSLTGAELLAFKICLENHINFEEFFFSFTLLKSTSSDK